MQLKLSFLYVISFFLLEIVMLELHETVHILVGFFICGCWGFRDFNVWSLCKGCEDAHPAYWLATAAGPLFSFAMMWLGMFWLSSKSTKKVAVGFSLIFANIPFGRLSETIKGAGDEITVATHLFKNTSGKIIATVVTAIIVGAFVVPTVIKAFYTIKNKRRWLYIVGFLIFPLLFLLLYVLTFLNGFLDTGFLPSIGIMGTPIFITSHTILAFALLLLMRKNIFRAVKLVDGDDFKL